MSKHKLSKTVLEMKFMKKTKIQQEKVRSHENNFKLPRILMEILHRMMPRRRILKF